MPEIAPDKTLNCIGLTCPEPMLRTTMEIKNMHIGQILLISASDPGSTNNMKSWSIRSGHKILKEEKEGDVYRFYVQKTK